MSRERGLVEGGRGAECGSGGKAAGGGAVWERDKVSAHDSDK